MNIIIQISKKKKILIISLLISFLFCGLLLSSPSIIRSDDLVFHLNRIRALANSINNGDFYPYLFQTQNFNYGYASPIFYSNILLYPAAILNCFGLTIIQSYKILMLLCTFLTCLSISYFLTEFTGNIFSISVGMFFYIFSGYRITDCYTRGALGEIFAFIFLPLVLYGIYNLFYANKTKWWLLTIGYTGLLLSHNITFLLSCFMFLVFLIINLRKIINDKSIFIYTFIAISISIGLSAFFLFPMLEQINLLTITNNTPLNTLVLTFSDILGIANKTYIFTPSLILILIPLFHFKSLSKSCFFKHTYFLGLVTIVLAMIPTLWKIQAFAVIQFPWRLLILSCILLIPAFLDTFDHYKISFKAILILSELVCVIYWLNCQIALPILSVTEDSQLNIDKLVTTFGDSVNYNSSELAHAEYLPNKEFNYRFAKRKINTNPLTNEEIVFSETYYKLTFTPFSISEETTYIIPLTYYKGYEVRINDLIIYPYPDSDNGFVTFVLSNEQSGKKVEIIYKGTKIQKLSFFISILTFLCFIIYMIKTKHNLKSKDKI